MSESMSGSSVSLTPRRVRPQVTAASPPRLEAVDEASQSPQNPLTFTGDLDALALTDADCEPIRKWETNLMTETMEYCTRCKHKWFDMALVFGLCRVCRRRDRAQSGGMPNFFSVDNALDFGDVPAHLPELSHVE
jgi:hypothetical protein